MLVKNYPQFSKKKMFLGLDKSYFMIFTIINFFIYVFCMIFATVLVAIIIIIVSFLLSVLVFYRQNYLIERITANRVLHHKYKTINNIYSR